MTGDRALLARVQRAIRAAAVSIPSREHHPLGAFDLYVETVRPERWFTFGIPRDDATPGAADVQRLRERCLAHERLPRVECLPALAPAAVAALLDGGFTVELEGPLMTCTAPREAPPVEGLTLEWMGPSSPESSIRAFDRVQRAAFGDPPAVVDVEASRKRMRRGRSVLGRLDGRPVATGVAVAPTERCAEIGGIGTLEPYRGRGVAAAITAALVAAAFEDDIELAFLTPGGPEAQRIYERAGFRGAGDFMHLESKA